MRDMIKNHFAKQGKKMSNISKAKKDKLLEIIEKYNIDENIYREELKQEELEIEEERKKEEEEFEKIKQERELNYKKADCIKTILYKKWYKEYMDKPNKNIIKQYYEYKFKEEENKYYSKQLLNDYKMAKKMIKEIPLHNPEMKYIEGAGMSIEVNRNGCSNLICNSNGCGLHTPVKIPVWRRRDIMKLF
tara:strand:- start:65 stop:634 length:570 start_codon:yes stop_codon:yes gene_type:complete